MVEDSRHGALASMGVQHGVAIITMMREARRNALSAALVAELHGMIKSAGTHKSVSGIVLTGGRKCFSAGADLQEALAIRTAEEFQPFADGAAGLMRAIEESPKPVTAAISGPCITGGLELALACDERIASAEAVFAMTSARIGSVAGFGGTQRLPRVIGSSAAKRMMFGARLVGAVEALHMGMVDEIVPEGANPVDLAIERLGEYKGSAPLSISFTKRAVNFGSEMPLEAGLQFERELCARAFATEDKREGMAAFLEKRAPHFEGH